MTRDEFEKGYASRCGVTMDWLKEERNLVSLPCSCGEEGCGGWQMRALGSFVGYEYEHIPEPYRSEIREKSKQLWMG